VAHYCYLLCDYCYLLCVFLFFFLYWVTLPRAAQLLIHVPPNGGKIKVKNECWRFRARMQCILGKTWKLCEPEKPEKVFYFYTRKLCKTDIWKEKKLFVKVVFNQSAV